MVDQDNYNNCKYCGGPTNEKVRKHNLVECQVCGLIFCNTIFSQDQLSKTYDDLYNNRASHYEYHTITQYKKLEQGLPVNIGYNRKRLIDKYIGNTHKSVLEVGSGVGVIGTYLKQLKVKNYLGLEIDKTTCLKSKRLGLNVLNKDFAYISKLPDQYDAVMLWEVLEHLQNFKLFLELAHHKLRKDGVLMFSVPNFDRARNYKFNKDRIYQDPPPIHLNFFTSQNIQTTLKLAGFKVEYLYKKRLPYLTFRTYRFYKLLLKALFLRFEGPTLYVVARKVD
jgi:2-polyprenyl-3-methyl-5-hydroxy-6-metoxy-1,4-benzoquinol methylase